MAFPYELGVVSPRSGAPSAPGGSVGSGSGSTGYPRTRDITPTGTGGCRVLDQVPPHRLLDGTLFGRDAGRFPRAGLSGCRCQPSQIVPIDFDYPDFPLSVPELQEPRCGRGEFPSWQPMRLAPGVHRCINRSVGQAAWMHTPDVGEYPAIPWSTMYIEKLMDFMDEFRQQMNSTTWAPSTYPTLCADLLSFPWVWDFMMATVGPLEGVRVYVNNPGGGRSYRETPMFPGVYPVPRSHFARMCLPQHYNLMPRDRHEPFRELLEREAIERLG